jgi:hypothetical protein
MNATRKSKPAILNELLTASSDSLASIFAHARRLARIQVQLRAGLPGSLASHVIVANADDSTLVIHTDSPAWAARLRYQIPVILDLAKEKCALASIHNVRIKVKIPAEDSVTSAREPVLSERARRTLLQSAESTEDPELQASLRRLARH